MSTGNKFTKSRMIEAIPPYERKILHSGAIRVVEDGRIRFIPKLLRSDGERLVCLRDFASRADAAAFGRVYVDEPSFKVPGELWVLASELDEPTVRA